MSAQVFYRKWRPQSLSEIAGQEHVTRTLLQALSTGRIAHAYLFSGPRGTGKTSTGRILAKAVNCLGNGHGEPCNQCAVCQAITQGNSMDVVEIDAASNRGIDDIRNLREKVAFVPGSARYKVYIVDEVHMLSEPAANALLKTLEEPPPHIIFILATTDPQKMPATILSRCQHFQFHRITQDAVSGRLAFICEKEGITAPPEALRLIARTSTGSLRDAANILEQTVVYYGTALELGQVKELLGLSSDARARELARRILEKDMAGGLDAVNQANSEGLDLRQFLRGVVNNLRQLLLLKAGAPEAVEVTQEELAEMKALAGAAPLDSILRALKAFSQIDMRMDNYSTLPLELALVESVIPEDSAIAAEVRPQVVAAPPLRPASAAPHSAARSTGTPSAETPLRSTGQGFPRAGSSPVSPGQDSPRAEQAPRPFPAGASVPGIEARSTSPASTPQEVPGAKPPAGPRPPLREPAFGQSGAGPGSVPTGRDPPPPPRASAPFRESSTSGVPAPMARPPAAQSPSPPPPGVPHLEYLQQHWREFLNSLRGEGSTGTLDALLRNACEPVAIEGDRVVFGFYWPMHKEKIEDPKYCFLVERKLNQFLGGTYKLRCVLTERKRRPSTGSGQVASASSPRAESSPSSTGQGSPRAESSPGSPGQVASASPTRSPSSAPSTGQGSSGVESSPSPRGQGTPLVREQATDASGYPGGPKKSPNHLVEAALREGGRIISTEEK